ncbi:unnamed protein product [Penicillium camemberti]|uniref:Str. FM013 n=1 Tax=Penicillium camemberti (strain FM 013) TaxID=1429867 RepID=A0A0G4PYU3_PENC3|nr:unnamed protein product [Penicillium camemberti]
MSISETWLSAGCMPFLILWPFFFYPQVIHNHRRRSTDGFSFVFVQLNAFPV